MLGICHAHTALSQWPKHLGCRKALCWRKRADGGYIVSQADATIFDIVPDSFRLAWAFRPILLQGLRQLRLRFGKAFFHELTRGRKWALDETTPFELERIANPTPAQAVLEEAAQRLKKAFPIFDQIQIAHRWGAYRRNTRCLTANRHFCSVPSLIFATGFSGHDLVWVQVVADLLQS